jgi:hypothetical protein
VVSNKASPPVTRTFEHLNRIYATTVKDKQLYFELCTELIRLQLFEETRKINQTQIVRH